MCAQVVEYARFLGIDPLTRTVALFKLSIDRRLVKDGLLTSIDGLLTLHSPTGGRERAVPRDRRADANRRTFQSQHAVYRPTAFDTWRASVFVLDSLFVLVHVVYLVTYDSG